MEKNITQNIIRAEAVSKSFDSEGSCIQVLKDVDFALTPRESVALLGDSGAGKSTLLHILGGLELASSGCVYFENEDLSQWTDKQRADFRNRSLGFVFQFHHLLNLLTVIENVALAQWIAGISKEESLENASKMLQRLGLGQRLDHKIQNLSGGEKQRVAIARALVNRPRLLLADEPTGNLDKKSSEIVFDLLIEAQRDFDLALVVVTHNEALAQRLDRVLRIENGYLN